MSGKLKYTNFYQEMMIIKATAEKENIKYTKDDLNKIISNLADKNEISIERAIHIFD